MVEQLFDLVLNIPFTLARFGNWLVNPIYEPYISISPLALFGIGGVSVIITIIGVHIIRLFVGG